MAKSSITSPTVLAHVKGTRWTEEDVRKALSELGFSLDQEYTGKVNDNHFLIYPNGDRRFTKISCVFCGDSAGKVTLWNHESVSKKLEEKGFRLDQEFNGRISDKHLVTFPTGEQKLVFLNSILTGQTKGLLPRLTEEEVIKRLDALNITLDQEFTGNAQEKHWVIFSSGIRKRITLYSIFNGKTTGKKPARIEHTEESVNEKLAEYGAVLAEPFKGALKYKHLVRLAHGEVKNIRLSVIVTEGRGYTSWVTQYTTEKINERLKPRGAVLLEEYKGNLNVKHHIQFGCGHSHYTLLCNVFQGCDCPHCAESGFNPSKPAILYFLEFYHNNEFVYKVGITNFTVKKRYKDEKVKPKILALFEHNNGGLVKEAEQEIIKTFYQFKYEGSSPFRKTGTTEMFIKDVSNHPAFLNIVQKCGLRDVFDLPIAN